MSGCAIFAALPGVAFGVALGIFYAELPWLARVALGALGALSIAVTGSILLASSGVLVDREARTVTPVFRWAWFEKRVASVRVEPDDRLVVETVSAPERPALANSVLLVRGPSGDRFLLGTRAPAEAERAGRAIAAALGIDA
ncbi:MAG: hypothetical protein KF729_21890 [Sandaracinaceae bacterium]|nr:hypothetical protein [Sandaracinaceae bacterium]